MNYKTKLRSLKKEIIIQFYENVILFTHIQSGMYFLWVKQIKVIFGQIINLTTLLLIMAN